MKNEERTLTTKMHLVNALRKLMKEKPFDKITVKELLDATNITRPTFYYHFDDIYDLMTWMFKRDLAALRVKCEDCVTWNDGVLILLRYLEQNRAVCLSAYNGIGRDTLERFLRESGMELMSQYVSILLVDIPAKPEDVVYITEFYTDALACAMSRWLRFPCNRTPEQMVEQLDIAMYGNIRASLERSVSANRETKPSC